jgi:hypothetical protein
MNAERWRFKQDAKGSNVNIPSELTNQRAGAAHVFHRLNDILSGNLTRRAVLTIWFPLLAACYFGTLTIAAWCSPTVYEWRRNAISRLLYPAYDPDFHRVASAGVAATGILLIPLAGYFCRQMSVASGLFARAAAFALRLGAGGLILAALIVSHPAYGTSAFPRLHEMFARLAAVNVGASVIAFWICATKGYLSEIADRAGWRRLAISLSAIALPALSIALVRVAVGMHLDWSNPLYRELQNRALWHLALWEWVGSAAVFLFLLSAAMCLPPTDSHR